MLKNTTVCVCVCVCVCVFVCMYAIPWSGGFTTHSAIPLSKATIFGGAVINNLINIPVPTLE